MTIDGRGARAAAAVVGVAVPSRHLPVAAGRRRDRPYARTVRDHARVPGSRHPAVPLHGGDRRRARHPLRAVRDVRHPGALRSRGCRARGPARLPARAPRDDRRRRDARSRARRWRSRSRRSPRCTGARCSMASPTSCPTPRWKSRWKNSGPTASRADPRSSRHAADAAVGRVDYAANSRTGPVPRPANSRIDHDEDA